MRKSKSYWLRLFALLLTIELVSRGGLMIFKTFSTTMLDRIELPLISIWMIKATLINHPFISLGFLIETSAMLLLIFWLTLIYTLSFLGIINQNFNLKSIWNKSVYLLGKYHIKGGIFAGLMLLSITPILKFFYKTPLLSSLTSISLISEKIFKHPFTGMLGILGSILGCWMFFKLFGTLYYLSLDKYTFKEALKKSWQHNSSKRMLEYFKQLGLNIALTWIPVSIILGILRICESFVSKDSDIMLISGGFALMSIWAIFTLSILPLQFIDVKPNKHRFLSINTLSYLCVILIITFGLQASIGKQIFSHPINPTTVSHRGVNMNNGVENTLQAFNKTVKYHPNYIEIDVQETKDHHFIVVHDIYLDKLAGIKKAPGQLPLKKLEKLKVTNDQHQFGKLVSLDKYLSIANAHHQKLLIDLKPSPFNSRNSTQNFLKQYKADIIKHHHQVHTLNFNEFIILKRNLPNNRTNYLLPYNFTLPESDVSSYGVRYSTLTPQFVSISRMLHKRIYAWTVDNPIAMKKALAMGVDSIVTDNIKVLQQQIKSAKHWSDTKRLLYIYLLN